MLTEVKEELPYIGNLDQLFKIRKVELLQGRGKGSELIEVDNGSGLHFEVNIDRGFDIPFLSFKGINIGFISPCGIVSPYYFDDKNYGFLKNFTVGFLTTCGLKNIGTPCEFEGKSYGLHGNFSNTPSSNSFYEIRKDKYGDFVFLTAVIKEANIFDDKLSLNRSIKCYYKTNKLIIDDIVTNNGFQKAIHNILYHFNIGYPVLSPESKVFISSNEIIPRDSHAEEFIYKWQEIEFPKDNFQEVCYYHNLIKNEDNEATVGIFNPSLNIGVAITIDCSTLDNFIEWKLMKKGDYVLGLEPANNKIEGVKDNFDNGRLKYIEPGENVKYHLEVSIVDSLSIFEK